MKSVWLNTVDYKGYGLLDDNLLNGKLRCPKLVRVELLRGEKSVKAIGIIIKVVDFKETKIGTANVYGEANSFFNFDVERLTEKINFGKEE